MRDTLAITLSCICLFFFVCFALLFSPLNYFISLIKISPTFIYLHNISTFKWKDATRKKITCCFSFAFLDQKIAIHLNIFASAHFFIWISNGSINPFLNIILNRMTWKWRWPVLTCYFFLFKSDISHRNNLRWAKSKQNYIIKANLPSIFLFFLHLKKNTSIVKTKEIFFNLNTKLLVEPILNQF